MPKFSVSSPPARAWLLEGPLAAHVPAYMERLKQGRYAVATVTRFRRALEHFACWMSMRHMTVGTLGEDSINDFLEDHLAGCACAGSPVRSSREVHAAVAPMLEILRAAKVLPALRKATDAIVEELDRYDAHMKDARGLAPMTRRGQLRIIGRLLSAEFAGQPVDIGELRADDVRRFIAKQLELVGTVSNAITIASALRSYLRYRASCGDPVHALLAAIVSPPHWSVAQPPRGLTTEEVERLLTSFTTATPSPHRGYAVVRLAFDLGLRCIEINRLQLDDIDWRAGTISLRRTKSRREDVLPLPVATGKALEAYIRHERPRTRDQAVFVRHHAPYGEPIGVHAIRRVVRDAFRRVGIAHGRSHALRHTLACQIVNSGGSIKEVADVLRHRSLNTSVIYAKLDRIALDEVALPWPGSTP